MGAQLLPGPARLLGALFAMAVGLCAGLPAEAQPTDGPDPSDRPLPDATTFVEAADLNAPFGPARTIEAIQVTGVSAAEQADIIAVLPFTAGDTLAAGDSLLRDARLRVLSLGTYRDASLRIAKGSQRGAIVVIIETLPRPTWSLNRLWIGSSHASALWFGGEVEKKNLWHRIDVAGSVLVALPSDVPGDATQTAVELSATRAPYLSMPFGGQLSLRHGDYHEPIRVAGASDNLSDSNFVAVGYRYTEATISGLWDVTEPTRLRAGPRIGALYASAVPDLARTHEGEERPINLGLQRGTNLRVSANVGIEFDLRDHPLNPRRGFFADLGADVLVRGLGSEYAAVKLKAEVEHWVSFRQGRGALGLLAQAQLVLGDPPRTDRIYVNDIYPWLPARSLGMSLATRGPRDLLDTSVDHAPSGNQAAAGTLRYVHRLIKKRGWIERGDWFVSAGAFVLRDTEAYNGAAPIALPIGLVFDLGVRLETRFGIAEISLANLGSRIP